MNHFFFYYDHNYNYLKNPTLTQILFKYNPHNIRTSYLKNPRRDSNPQSSAPETDALSIWPLGQAKGFNILPTTNKF